MNGFEKLSVLLILSLLTIPSACKNRSERLSRSNGENNSETLSSKDYTNLPVTKERKIGKAVFYIENSGSMFGYVNGTTNFVNAISELAAMPLFANERTPRDFFFINGGSNLHITPIGNDPVLLRSNLNRSGFTCGDISQSNLTGMFQVALEHAREDTITVLISDGIYDVGHQASPLTALTVESRETRTRFIERLGDGALQTIIIKMYSNFQGIYYFGSRSGGVPINQTRPYYIWIMGDDALLNYYYPDHYIQNLPGYADFARFILFEDFEIPFETTDHNILGDFRRDKNNPNRLYKARTDKYGQGFRFNIATDFSSLPYSDSYLFSLDHYTCTGNFRVISVSDVGSIPLYEVQSFTPKHLVTVYTEGSPYGVLEVSLKNLTPDWISITNTDDDSGIVGDTIHTYGLEKLISAITEAYHHYNNDTNIVTFEINILN